MTFVIKGLQKSKARREGVTDLVRPFPCVNLALCSCTRPSDGTLEKGIDIAITMMHAVGVVGKCDEGQRMKD